jgi:TnsA-like endonuclease N terminal
MKSNAGDVVRAGALKAARSEKQTNYVKKGEIVIQLPKKGALRARKVVSRSGVRHTGKYPSMKMGRMMQAESEHELHAFQLLDADPQVEAFYEQPFTIFYSIAGTVHSHVPDILVKIKGVATAQLWEVKETKELSDPVLQSRTQYLERKMPGMGYTYALILAESLKRGHLLKNAQRLLRFGKVAVSEAAREKARRLVNETGPLTWGAVERGQLGEKGLFILSRLVLEGYLTFDRYAPILQTTRFDLDEKSYRGL